MSIVENTITKSTYGAGLEYIGSDGIKRNLNVAQFKDGCLQIKISTYWDGSDKDAATTAIILSMETMSQLTSLMVEFLTNKNKYKQKEEVKS